MGEHEAGSLSRPIEHRSLTNFATAERTLLSHKLDWEGKVFPDEHKIMFKDLHKFRLEIRECCFERRCSITESMKYEMY